MLAVRGVPEDYDEWAESCPGWSYADVLPALKRLEDEQDFPDEPYHGRGGPIPIQRAPDERRGVLDRALRETALAAGYPWAPDYNAPGATGVSPFAFTARNGRRISTNDGYLEPARGRPNLTILGDQLVETVLFDQFGARARGVRTSDGTEHHADIGGEVVVCSGAVHSPAILMRSGVGPAAHLEEHGINLVADLPVGIALQEHPLLTITFPVVADAPVEAHAPTICVRYTSGLAGGGSNDMMILTGGGYKAQRLADDRTGQLLGGLRLWVMQSVSNGTLELTSRDPAHDPRIDLGLLSDERDLLRLEDGMHRVVDLLEHEPLASLVAGEPDIPSREDLLMVVGDGYSGHVSATCRMGEPGGAHTVVAPDCPRPRTRRAPGHRRVDHAPGLPCEHASLRRNACRACDRAPARRARRVTPAVDAVEYGLHEMNGRERGAIRTAETVAREVLATNAGR